MEPKLKCVVCIGGRWTASGSGTVVCPPVPPAGAPGQRGLGAAERAAAHPELSQVGCPPASSSGASCTQLSACRLLICVHADGVCLRHPCDTEPRPPNLAPHTPVPVSRTARRCVQRQQRGRCLEPRQSWKSTGNLQAVPAASRAASPEPSCLPAGSPGGLDLVCLSPPPAADVAAAMRKSASHSSLSLAGAAEARIVLSKGGLARRRSAVVGELSRLLAALGRASAVQQPVDRGPLPMPAVLPRRRGPAQLPAVAEHAPPGVHPAEPAGRLDKGPPAAALVLDVAGRTPGRVPRSKSLSVEDAVEVLARGQPLLDLPLRRAAAAPGHLAVQHAVWVPGAHRTAQAAAQDGKALAVAGTASHSPGVALPAPAATAHVLLQPIAASSGGGDNVFKPQVQQKQYREETEKARKQSAAGHECQRLPTQVCSPFLPRSLSCTAPDVLTRAFLLSTVMLLHHARPVHLSCSGGCTLRPWNNSCRLLFLEGSPHNTYE